MGLFELFAAAVVADLLFVLSLATHELGHALAASALRLKVLRIWAGNGPEILRIRKFELRLFPILGGTEIAGGLAKAPLRARVITSLAGPGASLVTAGGFTLVAHAVMPAMAAPLRTMAVANLALAVFNLLPVPPLDGWLALEPVLERAGWVRLTASQRDRVYRAGMVAILVAIVAFFAFRQLFG